MQVNWEKFQNAYAQASSNTKELIDSNAIVECVDAVCAQHSIPEDFRKEFILMYTYMVLGITNEKEVLNFLNIKVKPEEGADKVFSSLMICLAEKTKNNNSGPSTNSAVRSDIPDPPKPNQPEELRTLRTMEEDENRM